MQTLMKCFILYLHGGHLEILQTTFPARTICQIELKVGGRLGVTWKCRIAKFILYQYSRWSSLNSSNDLSSWKVWQIEQKLNWGGGGGGIVATLRYWIIRIVKNSLFLISKSLPLWASWNSSNHFAPCSNCLIGRLLGGSHRGNIGIQIT